MASRAPQAVADPAVAKAPTRQCPDCAETILAAAKVCKHCGSRFAPSEPHAAPNVPRGKHAKVKCHACQHVQTVPVEQSTFVCEECGAKFRRKTAPG
ncbi:hypothetical protein NJB1604_52980 [Mycobacterium marinum]|nr:hypothetical protein NJB1604_52980 [Mycobacterium marinum]